VVVSISLSTTGSGTRRTVRRSKRGLLLPPSRSRKEGSEEGGQEVDSTYGETPHDEQGSHAR
jgi:hypothetical protein